MTTVAENAIPTLYFGIITGIVAICKLVKIPLHMFTADMIICAFHCSFTKITPKCFYVVGVGSTFDIDTMTVVYNTMLINSLYGFVTTPFIHIKRCTAVYVTQYRCCKGFI